MNASTAVRYATDKQLSFIHSLLDQVSIETRIRVKADLETNWTSTEAIVYSRTSEFGDRLPIDRASKYIDRLLTLKSEHEAEMREAIAESEAELAAEAANERALSGEDRWEPEDPGELEAQRRWREDLAASRRAEDRSFLTTDEFPEIVASRYAVTGEDGTTDFYHVQHGKEGSRWEGTLFIKLHVAGREDQNLRGANARTIAEKIMADGPRNAAVRYGHELGRCSCCSRELTNPESIAAGIGPVCAEKAGW